MVIVKSKIKEKAVFEGKQLNVASDFADKLQEIAEGLIAKAAERANSNGRATVMGKDL
jgi:histone H3/H4